METLDWICAVICIVAFILYYLVNPLLGLLIFIFGFALEIINCLDKDYAESATVYSVFIGYCICLISLILS